MSNVILTGAFATTIALGALASPIIAGATPATGVRPVATASEVQQREVARREASFRAAYHRKHGTYPTEQQFRDWYQRTYRVRPA